MRQRKRKVPLSVLVFGVVIVLVITFAGLGLLYLVKTDSGRGGKKIFIAKVDLVRPDASPDRPPPEPKEKPPEPQVQKRPEIVPPPRDMPSEAGAQAAPGPKGDDKPVSEGPLGLEGEGAAGSDAFGLVGRGKGGRDVITLGKGFGKGGGLDRAALQRKYGWYTRIVEDEINRIVRKSLEEGGGMPKGTVEVEVTIELDDQGTITGYRIIRSSGNHAMDEAIKTLLSAKISQPPPKGIYRGMSYRITSR